MSSRRVQGVASSASFSGGANSALDETDLTGTVLADRYVLRGLIAKGRMGRVYRATQLPLERTVAVKVMNTSGVMADPRFEKRFFREASVSSQLNHPHIVQIYDYGSAADGRLYLVMELLAGRPLSVLIEEEGALDPLRVLNLSVQLARALRKAHANGVIHRDLKPANIMVSTDDEGDTLRVLDFGLVKLLAPDGGDLEVPQRHEPITEVGTLLGTPAYMSPEQALGAAVDERSDIYSFGILLFEMLAGHLPFIGTSMSDVLRAHLTRPVPELPLSVRQRPSALSLVPLMHRCLAKQASQRFRTSAELLHALKTIWKNEMDSSYSPRTSEVELEGPGLGTPEQLQNRPDLQNLQNLQNHVSPQHLKNLQNLQDPQDPGPSAEQAELVSRLRATVRLFTTDTALVPTGQLPGVSVEAIGATGSVNSDIGVGPVTAASPVTAGGSLGTVGHRPRPRRSRRASFLFLACVILASLLLIGILAVRPPFISGPKGASTASTPSAHDPSAQDARPSGSTYKPNPYAE